MFKTRKFGDLQYMFKNKEGIAKKKNIDNVLRAYGILSQRAEDIILLIKSNGDIMDANEVAIHKYGYSYDELLAMNIFGLRVDKRAIVEVDLKNSLVKGNIFETIHRKKDGSLINVQVNSQYTTLNDEKVILSIIRDITEQKIMENQLHYAERHDYLTGLANQYYLNEYLCQLRKNKPIKLTAVLLANIDNFKIANDTYGYSAGNSILNQIIKCFQRNLRKNDFFARNGKDEFVIILPEVDKEEVKLAANRLLQSLNQENFIFGESLFKVSVSIGVGFIETANDIDSVFSYADIAMRTAKEEGKNRVVIIQNAEERGKVNENNRILTLLNDAIKTNKFKLFAQPIRKKEKDVLHYEALIRMVDKQGEILAPGNFLPLAERYGLMLQIDKWVIQTTIELLENRDDLNIFVNISGESLGDDLMLTWIESHISNSAIDPRQIGFEITESSAIRNIAKAEQWINRLKALGCYFALDDFGVGFSSFAHLQTLPVDYLKIDGSFIKDLDSDSTKRALVEAMIAVAHTLGKKTIAEYVENENVWRILHELHIDYGQGFYLGKPNLMGSI
jgi:diguanylate cyclase (GGDEF)-like protein/PAS domain S-box-containing protein